MANKAKTRPKGDSAPTSRVRQLDKKQAKAKAKKEAAKLPPMPSSFNLLGQVYDTLKRNWKVLSGIVLVYSLLNIIFASGLISSLDTDISNIRQSHGLSNALNGYSSLLGGSSGASGGSSLAQSALLVFESLVIIWTLRQLLSGQKITIKQAYYQSMAPLVPFLLVILVIIIQLLPLSLGSALLALILSSAIGNSGFLSFIFAILLLPLVAWSVYMVSASVFSLYIVTLPEMQPRQALRSAKNLVRYRRWQLLRRLFFLPIFVLLVLGIISVSLILILPFLVVPVFFVLLMLSILFIHSYLYSLYRGLIT